MNPNRFSDFPPPSKQGFARREFLMLTGLAAGGLAFKNLPIMAGPFTGADFEKLVPSDKKLDPAWLRSLFERGRPSVYRWPESELIGMPVGGICAGQLYLGGNGKLWRWDIFNQVAGTGDRNYAHPPPPASPVEQGFALQIRKGEITEVRPLDHTGWREVSFRGEYPIGLVEYQDPNCPVSVSMEAFSPFIPLNEDDSGLPATIMRFTLRNQGTEPVELELAGWLENAVCMNSARSMPGQRRNRLLRRHGYSFVESTAEPIPQQTRPQPRAEIIFEDFESDTYKSWTAAGTAFGNGPVEAAKMPDYQGDVGAQGRRTVNSHATAPGAEVGARDSAVGTLTSKPFAIERDYINFLIGGGSHAGRTCMNLLVDDKPVLSATGRSDNRMQPRTWDVRRWAGKLARLQIVDNERGPWGNVGVDQIAFSDTPAEGPRTLAESSDFGSMGLALLHKADETVMANCDARLGLPSGIFARTGQITGDTTRSFGEKLIGSLSRGVKLGPSQTTEVIFVVAWHFPRIKIDGLSGAGGRWYGNRFGSALDAADYVINNFGRLSSETRLWRDTWYDSSLPYWFLDRTFLNISILATNTCYRFASGRFYGWEGVGCCAGTCTHVWHYAQAMGRLFPALERNLREQVDYGVAFEAETGRIRFRAEHNNHWAVDGQCGCILRTWREHQMSADDAFLRRVWPRVKKSLQFVMSKDPRGSGLVEGPQHNTLDADWWGSIAWLSGLYLAALRAGEEMARENGDPSFASECRQRSEAGRKAIDALFNGEYYIHVGDPAHAKTVGSYDGCEIDQVLGQSWAWQAGLGRIMDESKVKTALRSLWRYNFTPDVGPYRAVYKPGRWYAMAGEGGLLMCTWPRGEARRVKESFDFYFNECMTGFEYQAAGHMVAEGMLQEGLAITRTIHDRYHPARRNPWNEVECGDHYARAMASYGVFLAVCGFEYHGPKGRLAFAPRLKPEAFQAPFTTAEAWGTFSQRYDDAAMNARLEIKWGKLDLKTLALELGPNMAPTKIEATIGERKLDGRLTIDGRRASIAFAHPLRLDRGQKLELRLT